MTTTEISDNNENDICFFFLWNVNALFILVKQNKLPDVKKKSRVSLIHMNRFE